MPLPAYPSTVEARFLRYVQIDTQSDPTSPTCPSTEKQKDLARVLVEELQAMGVTDAEMDEHGYVYATVPGNSDKVVPTICFCSHMDTSPDSSGTGVKPIVHRNYQGQDLMLPDDSSVVIREAEHPDLRQQHGHDIVTASGTTLLGADNKAGLAAIMDAAHYLLTYPEVKHGPIRLLFTPDEEIGRGADKVNLAKLGAAFGYTVDGEVAGSMEDETFSADGAKLLIEGVSAHPGFAKGRLVSAMKIAAEVLAALPKDRLSPETTEGKEGFIHPVGMQGTAEQATVEFILRDFDDEKLQQHGRFLQKLVDGVMAHYPQAKARLTLTEQYRNMKQVLDQHPKVVAYAEAAIKRAGLPLLKRSIRGGTDGSRLSFMGLPCPNIFAGEHAFHSKQEWVSIQDMEKAAETVVHLARIWEENGEMRKKK
jgi:tripeptide aminopeptidase